MTDLLEKEVLKASSSLGENLAPMSVCNFVKNLKDSSELEIRSVYYGNVYTYSCSMLVVECFGTLDVPIHSFRYESSSNFFNTLFFVEICLDGSWDIQLSDGEGNPVGYVNFDEE